MQTYFGFNHHALNLHSCAITIGNFDGVHKGHLHILQCLKKEADQKKLPSVLITFEPLANEYFAQTNPQHHNRPVRISTLHDKLALIEKTGLVDIVIIVDFDANFSGMDAKTFVTDILIRQLNTQYLLIGDDFKFGKARQGDYVYLAKFSEFKTKAIPSIMIEDTRISSSVIRQALIAGNFKQARLFLGYDYFISGEVKHGLKLGRQLGCPTANIELYQLHFPLSGIYVVEVKGGFGQKKGVASFGTNPTISDDLSSKLEAHLFDFDDDLYGQILTVIFKTKIRDELKFANLDELKNQIAQDMVFAKYWQDSR